MSKEYEIEVIAQPSLYKPKDRTLRIYFFRTRCWNS